jgi:eukaryotic-like serine/threonine-protein kinase
MTGGDDHSWLDGRYELGEIIGRGGMATVYRSHDHRTERDVAVKVFRPGADLNDADQRYRREVMLLAGLCDPGLVTVYDADLDDVETPYLVTELVHGPTLSEQIRKAPLTEAQVGRLGAALARTLAYVHGHDIVHRDVKPANILLPALLDDLFAGPKLVDFGIAIASDSTRLTGANLTLGTANYLSPEQIRGGSVTSATDVYSLGLVLIEALSGEAVYPGHGMEAAMARLGNPPVVPATVGDELRVLLTTMTATDTLDRPGAGPVADRLDDLNASRATEVVALPGLGAALVPIAGVGNAGEPGASAAPAAGSRDAAGPGTYRSSWADGRRRSSWPRTFAAAGALIVLVLFGLAAIASFTGRKAPAPVHRTPSPQAAPSSAHPSTPNPVRTTPPGSSTVAVAPPVVIEPRAPEAPISSSASRSPSTTASRPPSTPANSSPARKTSAPSRSSEPPSPSSPPSSSPLPTPTTPMPPPTPTLTIPPTPTFPRDSSAV